MIKWSSRVLVYKVSLVCTYLVFLVYALAFVIPMWLGKDPLLVGLWMIGEGDDSEIKDVDGTFFNEGPLDEDWFDGVRGLMLGGMAFYVIAIAVSLMENCCVASTTRDYGVTGALTFMAGLCGGVAVVVTAIKAEDSDVWKDTYRWGYMLAAIASGLAIIFALILLITRNSGDSDASKSSRTADYVYAHNKHMPYAPEYNNPGYRGDELPLVNGVPFHQSGPYNHAYLARPGFNGNDKLENGTSYYPYGYKDQRPGNRISLAESADLSNGFMPGMIHNDYSLGRRGEYTNGGPQYTRGDYFYNGSRPY